MKKILIGILAVCSAALLAVRDFGNRLVDVSANFADEEYCCLDNLDELSIIIHHTGAEKCQLNAMDNWHKHEGYGGLAYPFVVTDTAIYKVHQETSVTIHAGNRYYNHNSIAVCLSGDFNKRRPTAAELRNLAYTIIYLMVKYGIPYSRVYTHGEVCDVKTDCCGRYLKEWVQFFRCLNFTDRRVVK